LLIESDECFEAAKNYLTDKKYKEAIAGFTKSLNINPQNYDSLFYRAVSQLDFGQPQKAIEDLC
jgi:tetratricopeptide (TPR) repeat protein